MKEVSALKAKLAATGATPEMQAAIAGKMRQGLSHEQASQVVRRQALHDEALKLKDAATREQAMLHAGGAA